MLPITEQNINDYIGKEVFCSGTNQVVLLRGYRGNGLAQITFPERFWLGKYPRITHDCLLQHLKIMD
jgi:hypothetical protein